MMHNQLHAFLDRAWQEIAANAGPVAIGIDAATDEDNWGICVLIPTADLHAVQMPILLPQQRINATGRFFLKQLGRRPSRQGKEFKLRHQHGGDWSEWVPELRVREMPEYFYSYTEQIAQEYPRDHSAMIR